MYRCFHAVGFVLRAALSVAVMLLLGAAVGLFVAPTAVQAALGRVDVTGADGTTACCVDLGTTGGTATSALPESLRTPPRTLGQAVDYVSALKTQLDLVDAQVR